MTTQNEVFKIAHFKQAGIAQLVEHNLAKVRVEGSSPFSRSIFDLERRRSMAEWQNGHAAACKAVYAGSIPTSAFLF